MLTPSVVDRSEINDDYLRSARIPWWLQIPTLLIGSLTMSTSPDTPLVESAAVPKPSTQRTTWGEILVCGAIIALALYFLLFTALLADALFFERNLIIKPIENNSHALRNFIRVIYYPEIVVLRFFRVIPG